MSEDSGGTISDIKEDLRHLDGAVPQTLKHIYVTTYNILGRRTLNKSKFKKDKVKPIDDHSDGLSEIEDEDVRMQQRTTVGGCFEHIFMDEAHIASNPMAFLAAFGGSIRNSISRRTREAELDTAAHADIRCGP